MTRAMWQQEVPFSSPFKKELIVQFWGAQGADSLHLLALGVC